MIYRDFYPLQEGAIRPARNDFRTHAFRSQLPADIAEAAELCLSELASNAVEHAHDHRARAWFHVSCQITGRYRRSLRLAVHDIDGQHIPSLTTREKAPELLFSMDEAEEGRGLLLVAMYADEIGIEYGRGINGKEIWCSWDLDTATGAERTASDPRAAWATPAL
jgi:anti-sigma regulatory factor (Ser/Thr protein kinase)